MKAQFLSITEDLLKCLKEDLINKLVIVSASNGTRKNDKTAKTFGKLANVELSIQKPGRFRERRRV